MLNNADVAIDNSDDYELDNDRLNFAVRNDDNAIADDDAS